MEAARKNEGEIAEMLIEHGARTGMVMKVFFEKLSVSKFCINIPIKGKQSVL